MKKTGYKLAETQSKFGQFYQKNLRDIYQQLEPKRFKYIRRFFITAVIGLFLIGSLLLLCSSGYISPKVYESEGFIKLAMIALCCFGVALYTPFHQYRTETKSRVMRKILSFWGDFKYFHEQNIIGTSLIKDSELFTYFNREEIDDAFRGTYKNASLEVSEHNLRIHGNKGDTNIFKGIFILLDFNKKFAGKTLVLSRARLWQLLLNNPILFFVLVGVSIALMITSHYILIGLTDWRVLFFIFLPPLVVGFIIYAIWKKIKKPRATQKVILEGIPFLKRWKVFTDNQIEARYILTPVLMEKITELKKLFHGHCIDCSFFDNKLLIAVHTRKNLFETTSLFVPALSYHKVRQVINQLHSIFSVIELLDLPEK
ncbi:MAG: DUF3137 domain-containing protein [Alphaproteobacteria bacterium]|nr:DUF3137 domain-containing protein [Alphaproteobacteria bacterium]